jgi:hypothetical protein
MRLAETGEDPGKPERGQRREAADGEVAGQCLAGVGGGVGEFLAVGQKGPEFGVERATRAGQGQAVRVVTQHQGHAKRLLQLAIAVEIADWETISSRDAAVMLPHSTAAAK